VKRYLHVSALVLSVLLLFVTFAGCAGQDKGDKSDVVSEPKPSESKDDETDADELTTSFDKKIEISYFRVDGGQYETTVEEDPCFNFIEEKFNVEIEYMPVAYGDWTEKYKVMISTGTMADIMQINGINSPSEYIPWVKDGVFKALPDDLSKWPMVAELISRYPDQKIDGKWWSIPVSQDIDPSANENEHAIYCRKDYFDKYGLSLPNTVEELMDAAEIIQREEKAQGNSVYAVTAKDTYWYNEIVMPYMKENPMGFLKETEGIYAGKWVPAWLTLKWWKGHEIFRIMYKKGLLDPDFAINTEDQMLDKFAMGSALTISWNGSLSAVESMGKRVAEANPGIDPIKAVTILPNYMSDDGNRYDWEGMNWWAATVFPANISDEKLERILYILDWMATEEGLTFSYRGIEGEHYVKEGDEYVSLLGEKEDGTPLWAKDKYRCAPFRSAIVYGQLTFVNKESPYYPIWEQHFKNKQNTVQMSRNLFYVDTETVLSGIDTATARVDIILKDDPIEDLWKAFVDQMRKDHPLDQYIEELQDFAKSQGK